MTNVMFGFVMGLLIACFGMHGRMSSKLPVGGPVQDADVVEAAEQEHRPEVLRRHPREAASESRPAQAGLPAGGASRQPRVPARRTVEARYSVADMADALAAEYLAAGARGSDGT
ncbi:hypothetical protein ABZZ79_05925 [Streptomyces sp. NPDC006458]|uniref:hypothetical protein n=1 Tax=Streptomyces sp. NPDC006458 TaxID=3154302 RepID=UPI0033B62090